LITNVLRYFVLWALIFEFEIRYREAVATQSPRLFQPWELGERLTNPERVASLAILDAPKWCWRLTQPRCGWFAGFDLPRVEATLGHGT
jgi:hypothetical protein